MAPAPKKRRLNGDAPLTNDSSTNGDNEWKPPLSPATSDEKRQWQGFCEIDSEPAYFNVMLRDWGVRGVKVQEVYGLDDAMLAFLPQPVYGLIFLFRYRPDDVNKQEMSCPEHVWFANQTHDHACATVSLLNIVNNIPNADLGENLQRFKEFTKTLTPALRGDQIGNFEFVKQIHNSFTRKMDMLNIDLGLHNQYDARNKAKAKAKPPATNKRSKTAPPAPEDDEDLLEDDSAFHFIAYVPIASEVWKLDGLDRHPQKLGPCSPENWLQVVRPNLEDRMAQYMEGQIQFVLLSLVKDPLIARRAELLRNIVDLRATEARLGSVQRDWEVHAGDEQAREQAGLLRSADLAFGITPIDVEESPASAELGEKLDTESPEIIMAVRRDLVSQQVTLRQAVRDEQECVEEDERRARERRWDYGPLIYSWLRMLAEKDGVMRELVEGVR